MTKHSIMNSEGFGISNGVSTIIALLAGFVAADVSKVPVISAMLSLLLTDPLNDSYSIYISMKDSDKDEAFRKFMGTFKTQLIIQMSSSQSEKICHLTGILLFVLKMQFLNSNSQQ